MESKVLTQANFIKMRRREQGVAIKQLCKGLCSESTLQYYEKGKRSITNELLNRIMERLGVGVEDYEQYVDNDTYQCWEARMDIIYGLAAGDYASVNNYLSVFKEEYAGKHEFERQFYLRMKAMYLACTEGDVAEIAKCLKEAIAITVPTIEAEQLGETWLSVQEIDMILDYYWYAERKPEHFLALAQYCKERNGDNEFKSKTLPKAVYYYYCSVKETFSTMSELELLSVEEWLSVALEEVRTRGTMMEMWEILIGQREVFRCLEKYFRGDEKFISKQSENNLEIESLLWLEKETGLEKETTNTAIYYAIRGVYNVADVIRRRRKMLHMSVEQLTAGILDEKTIRRIETGAVKGRQENLELIFEGLKLPTPMIKSEYLISNMREKELIGKLAKAMEGGGVEEAKQVMLYLNNEIDEETLYNKQRFAWDWARLNRKSGDTEKFYENVCRVIKMSVPLDSFYEDIRYFTHNELLYYKSLANHTENKVRFVEYLERYYENNYGTAQEINEAGIMESVLDTVQCIYGNLGLFEESNRCCQQILRIVRVNKFLYSAIDTRYALWWNDYEEKKTTDITPLSYLKTLSELIYDKASADFYQRKIDSLS
ncbi:Helix-turn-helix [Lachnospiraceae bacterium XBB1006]|nr:Helix-turn-helix [Lachnospiraceae bacterium XBB1006]